ncbi:hypothetical protein Acr_27g0009420 [Actinidia rufa]|uniref:Uncharacterized protein n=1 Tax=Actinidia rufa TaxID=165716 RepID=A0A7J0H7X0_9ERIC|nr:hypothetical protein Acr_27g0009420 [Actinidia rufa]
MSDRLIEQRLDSPSLALSLYLAKVTLKLITFVCSSLALSAQLIFALFRFTPRGQLPDMYQQARWRILHKNHRSEDLESQHLTPGKSLSSCAVYRGIFLPFLIYLGGGWGLTMRAEAAPSQWRHTKTPLLACYTE